jgi:hypothetical protein
MLVFAIGVTIFSVCVDNKYYREQDAKSADSVL